MNKQQQQKRKKKWTLTASMWFVPTSNKRKNVYAWQQAFIWQLGGMARKNGGIAYADRWDIKIILCSLCRSVVRRSIRTLSFRAFCCWSFVSRGFFVLLLPTSHCREHLYVFFCFRLMCSTGMPIVRYRVVLTLSVLDTGTVRTLSHMPAASSTEPTRISYAQCARTPQIIIEISTEMLLYNMQL